MSKNDSKIVVGEVKHRRSLRLSGKVAVLVAIAVLLLTGCSFWLIRQRQSSSGMTTELKTGVEFAAMNEYMEGGDDIKASEHARKALAYAPNDIDVILASVIAIEKTDADQAKQLYVQALGIFKKQDDPDVDGKNPATYWAAGSLAKGAGLKDEAKNYFQKAIDVADPTSSDDLNIIAKSEEALEVLR